MLYCLIKLLPQQPQLWFTFTKTLFCLTALTPVHYYKNKNIKTKLESIISFLWWTPLVFNRARCTIAFLSIDRPFIILLRRKSSLACSSGVTANPWRKSSPSQIWISLKSCLFTSLVLRAEEQPLKTNFWCLSYIVFFENYLSLKITNKDNTPLCLLSTKILLHQSNSQTLPSSVGMCIFYLKRLKCTSFQFITWIR